jgi:hypothetical protein
MNASWQGYVDYMRGKGNIENCMVIDAEDGFCWASTEGFGLHTYTGQVIHDDGSEKDEEINEAQNLVLIMTGGQRTSQGLRINKSRKIQIMREFKDDETKNAILYGKFAKGGCCIAMAGPCMLIGTFDENKGHTAAGCNEVVTLMARHLIRSPSWGKCEAAADGGSEEWQSYVDLLLVLLFPISALTTIMSITRYSGSLVRVMYRMLLFARATQDSFGRLAPIFQYERVNNKTQLYNF